MQRYKAALKADSRTSHALQNYCSKCGISAWSFITHAVTEELQKPLDRSIAENKAKRSYTAGSKYDSFYFGISDPAVQEKLRIIVEQYGVSLNWFFVKTITEKLMGLGYRCDNTVQSVRKPRPVRESSDAEQIRDFIISLNMRRTMRS